MLGTQILMGLGWIRKADNIGLFGRNHEGRQNLLSRWMIQSGTAVNMFFAFDFQVLAREDTGAHCVLRTQNAKHEGLVTKMPQNAQALVILLQYQYN